MSEGNDEVANSVSRYRHSICCDYGPRRTVFMGDARLHWTDQPHYDSFVDNKIYVVQGRAVEPGALSPTGGPAARPLGRPDSVLYQRNFSSRSPLLSITEIPPQPRLSQFVPWRGRSFPVLLRFLLQPDRSSFDLDVLHANQCSYARMHWSERGLVHAGIWVGPRPSCRFHSQRF